jgi:hypothetical protein
LEHERLEIEAEELAVNTDNTEKVAETQSEKASRT